MGIEVMQLCWKW